MLGARDWFADLLWIEGRRIIRRDGVEIPLTDEGVILIAMLRLAAGSAERFAALRRRLEPRRFQLLRSPARRAEAELWRAIQAADIAGLAAHCRGCSFAIEPAAGGWRLTGQLRVIT